MIKSENIISRHNKFKDFSLFLAHLFHNVSDNAGLSLPFLGMGPGPLELGTRGP